MNKREISSRSGEAICMFDEDQDWQVVDPYMPPGPSMADDVDAGGEGLAGLLDDLVTPRTKLVSFDVFDTVLTRRSGDPKVEFLFIGQLLRERGLIGCSAESFAQTRYACEKRVRCNKRWREVTLREIYEEMTGFLGLDGRVDELMDIEMEVETQSIGPIPKMREVVDAARKRFGRVVFISDMYLDGSFIEGRLKAFGLYKPGDHLYLSSTYGVQKGNGRLFRIVLDAEGVMPGELLHCGNSWEYDVLPARRLGIGSYFFNEGNPHPSEEILNNHAVRSEGISSLLAGAARRARLAGVDLKGDEKAIWDTGACVTGPLVYLYASWILDRAKQKGIRQLYFLARDAYPVYMAVQAMLENRPELGMQARYIYGSRPTYYAMRIRELGEAEWDYLTSHGGHQYATLTSLQAGLMVSKETLSRHLGAVGLADADWDVKLADAQLELLKRHALNDEAFNRDLLSDIHGYQALLKRYFAEQGFDPGQGVALIDSGWTSRSHAPLFHFLEDMGCENLRVFYIGLIVEETYIPEDAIDTFMFNRTTKQGFFDERMVYTRALETLFASYHGRTIGFAEEEGRVLPVLAPLEDPVFAERYLGTYMRGIGSFLEQMKSLQLPIDGMHDMRYVAERVLQRFWQTPTYAEAHVWAQLTWEWDPQGQIQHTLAHPYRIIHAVDAFVQNQAPSCNSQFWVGGAKRLTPLYVLAVLKGAIWARRFLGQIARIIPERLRDRLTLLRRRVMPRRRPDMVVLMPACAHELYSMGVSLL